MSQQFSGRPCAAGEATAEVIVALEPFGFWQGIDPATGIVINRRHPLLGESLAGKAFVFSYGRGSTGNPGVFMEAVRNKVAPAALIAVRAEPMITLCSILAEQFYGVQIPVVDALPEQFYTQIRSGAKLRINGDSGIVEIL